MDGSGLIGIGLFVISLSSEVKRMTLIKKWWHTNDKRRFTCCHPLSVCHQILSSSSVCQWRDDKPITNLSHNSPSGTLRQNFAVGGRSSREGATTLSSDVHMIAKIAWFHMISRISHIILEDFTLKPAGRLCLIWRITDDFSGFYRISADFTRFRRILRDSGGFYMTF